MEKYISIFEEENLDESKDRFYHKDPPSYYDVIYQGENYTITQAIYIKVDGSGWQTREEDLATAKGVNGKYSHREKAYIVSPKQAERFVKYVNEGWGASAFTGELEPPLKEAFVPGNEKPDTEGGKYIVTKGIGRDKNNSKKFISGWFKTKNPAKPTKPKHISKSAAKKRARKAVKTKVKKGARAKKIQVKKMLQTKKKNKQIG